MAINAKSGGKDPKFVSRETTPGIRLDSGPFIGVIKNNVDPTKQGRLDVWIPDFGGNENVKSNWYNVAYASPFFGATLGNPGSTEFNVGQQTYGFWAVPPDINNLVLVTFVMGDPSRGYWFACIQNVQSNQMLPANSRPNNIINTYVQDEFAKRGVTKEHYLPVSEPNLESEAKDKDSKYLDLPRRLLNHQANVVLAQGLETDPLRGTVVSSSQREAPSSVVGLSSPGRPFPDLAEVGDADWTIERYQNIPFRKGGHSLVMDDGDLKGKSQLLRLRSAGGHTVLMDDTNNIFYIVNSKGTAWVEIVPDGSINVFSDSSINIRAAKDINMHADGNIKMHAGDTIQMYAEKQILTETQVERKTAVTNFSLNAGKIGIKSDSSLLMQAVTGGWKCSGQLILKGSKIFLNTMAPPSPETNEKFQFINHENSIFDDGTKRWYPKPNMFSSIIPHAPTHEPWTRQPGVPTGKE